MRCSQMQSELLEAILLLEDDAGTEEPPAKRRLNTYDQPHVHDYCDIADFLLGQGALWGARPPI